MDSISTAIVASCPFCSLSTDSMEIHLNTMCIKKPVLKEKKQSAFVYIDNTSVCLRCFSRVSSGALRNHLRSCKRNFEKSIRQQSSRMSNLSACTGQSKQKQTSTINIMTQSPASFNNTTATLESLQTNTVAMFQNFLMFSSQPFLIQWLKDHTQFRKIFLFEIFQKFVLDMQKRLTHRIPRLLWTDFGNNIGNFEWRRVFRRPQEIFDRQFVLEVIKNVDKNVSSKVLTRINKIYSKYPDLFIKFKVQHEKVAPKFIPKPLCHIELIDILEKLLETKIRKFVHISLDLMILFQAGQRYPSTIPIIQPLLLKYLQSEGKCGDLFFQTSKTKKIVLLIISAQLLKMLKQFQWTGFYFNRRFKTSIQFYARISKYLPFTIYAIRHGYICFLQLMEASANKSTLNLLTQHSKKQNLSHYTQSVVNKRLQIYKSLLKFPNSKIQYESKDDILLKLPKTDQFFVKIKLESNWFQVFFQSINTDDQSMDIFDFLQINKQFIPPVPIASQVGQNKLDQQQNDERGDSEGGLESSSEDEGDVTKEMVMINNAPYERSNQLFNLKSLMIQVSQGACSTCLLRIEKRGSSCKYCGDDYHTTKSCLPEFCPCLQVNLAKKGFPMKASSLTELKIKMDPSYFGRNEFYLKQMRFLTHVRGFAYTHTSVCHQLAINFPFQQLEQMNIGELKLDGFDDYRQLKYIPPLKIILTNENNSNGAGFGLQADEDIEKDVFIGQYAADVLLRSQTYLLRRTDMIMTIKNATRSSESLEIAPMKFCSYCLLINEDKLRPNCAAQICIIEDQLKIVLFTTTKIKKGQQLTYDYNMLYKGEEPAYYAENKRLSGYEQPIVINLAQSMSPTLNKQTKIAEKYISKFGIKNIKNNCYLSSILQMLRSFQEQFKINQNCKQEILIKVRQFYNTQTIFDPSSLLEPLLKNSQFTENKEEDAHQFFDYLMGLFQNEKISTDFIRGLYQKEITCTKCLNISIVEDPFRQIILAPNQHLDSIFEKVEQLQDFLCKCECRGRASMKTRLIRLPKLLLFVINRFKYAQKDNRRVDLPNVLIILNSKFKKRFVVLHSGQSMKHGHYTAINLQYNILYNDEKVTQANTYDTKMTYMLLFEAIQMITQYNLGDHLQHHRKNN